MKTIIQNQTYTIVPGLFKDGKIIPSVEAANKEEAGQEFLDSKWVPVKEYKQELRKAGYNERFIRSAVRGYKQSKLYQNKRELTEEEVLKIVKDGEKAYKEGRTENYDTWMLREYPNIYKTNRSYGNKN